MQRKKTACNSFIKIKQNSSEITLQNPMILLKLYPQIRKIAFLWGVFPVTATEVTQWTVKLDLHESELLSSITLY